MKKLSAILIFVAVCFGSANAQKLPCSAPEFREFDFWIGNWKVYGKKQQLAGTSKISLILDSCVILEEWTSAGKQSNLIYQGKSFNSYNSSRKQWQQTWVDNTGNTTEYLRGTAENGKIIFYADNVADATGKSFMRRLSFTKISDTKVRQLGEKSEDNGKTWTIEFDLEYRKI